MTKVNAATQKHEAGVIALEDYHVEWYVSSRHTKKNKRIVDACQFVGDSWAGKDGWYEVVYMDGEGNVLDECRTKDYREMQHAFSLMFDDNCPKDWFLLTIWLGKAKRVALSVKGDDGGTCNFDAPALSIPNGMNCQQVKACCTSAGVSCFEWKPFKNSPKMIVLCGCSGPGQASLRTAGAEAACAFLRQRGYDCGMYYQMD